MESVELESTSEKDVLDDLECRVCRSGAEPNRPLCRPCHCTGSIAYVHQDCLEMWLDRTKKDSCEICSAKFYFDPIFSSNMPASLSMWTLFKGSCSVISFGFLPRLLTVVLGLSLWLAIFPLFTTAFARKFIRFMSFSNLLSRYSSPKNIYNDIGEGYILIATFGFCLFLAVSIILLVRVYIFDIDQFDVFLGDQRQRRNRNRHRGQNRHQNQNQNQVRGAADAVMPINIAMEENPQDPRIAVIDHDDEQQTGIHRPNVREPLELGNFDTVDAEPVDEDANYRNNHVNNHENNEPNDDNEENDERWQEIIEVLVDIRGVILEFLSLNGPLTQMLTNICLSCLSIIVFYGVIGFCRFCSMNFAPVVSMLSPSFLVSFVKNIERNAIQSDVPLRLSDWFSLLCVLRNSLIGLGFAYLYLKKIGIFFTTMKVSLVLLNKMFISLLFVGALFILIVNLIYQYSSDQWAIFIAQNLVGSIVLMCSVGMCFKIISTIVFLQLREILHPSFLAHVMRFQESHKNIAIRTVEESAWEGFKNVAVAWYLYLLFMVIVFLLPVTVGTKLGLFVTDLKVCYFSLSLQLMLETTCIEFFFVNLLAKYEKHMGRLLFSLFNQVSSWFGVSKFFLPWIKRNRDVATSLDEQDDLHRESVLVIRPPQVWSEKEDNWEGKADRWSYVNQPPIPLELELLPPALPPSLPYLRIALFCLTFWLIGCLSMIFLIAVPVRLGRLVWMLLSLPETWQHDPLNLFIGCYVCTCVWQYRHFAKKALNSLFSMIRESRWSTWKLVGSLIFKAAVIQVLFGVLLTFLLVPMANLNQESLSISRLLPSGCAVLSLLILSILLESPLKWLVDWGLPWNVEEERDWICRLRGSIVVSWTRFLEHDWDSMNVILGYFFECFIDPLYQWMIRDSGIVVLVIVKLALWGYWTSSSSSGLFVGSFSSSLSTSSTASSFSHVEIIINSLWILYCLISLFPLSWRVQFIKLWSAFELDIRKSSYMIGTKLRSIS